MKCHKMDIDTTNATATTIVYCYNNKLFILQNPQMIAVVIQKAISPTRQTEYEQTNSRKRKTTKMKKKRAL